MYIYQCWYSNAINHPPVITISMGGIPTTIPTVPGNMAIPLHDHQTSSNNMGKDRGLVHDSPELPWAATDKARSHEFQKTLGHYPLSMFRKF